jgi:GGDEF domain-containing protein
MSITDFELEHRKKEWSKFLNVFGNLMPGGFAVYECLEKIKPLYLSPGVMHLWEGFTEEEYAKAEIDAGYMLLDGEREKFREALETMKTTGKMLECVLRYRKTPKKNGWVWIRGRMSETEGFENILLVMVEDVTRQKKLENELTIQSERYRILEQTSNEILFDLHLDEDELTYSYKEIDGDLIRQRIPHYSEKMEKDPIVHPDYLDMFRQCLQAASSKKMDGQLEYLSGISGHGQEWHRMYYSSLTDENGRVNRIIGRIKNVHDEVLKRQKEKDEIEFGELQISGIRHRIWQQLENAEFDDKHTLAIISINYYKRTIEQNGVSWGDAAVKQVAGIMKQVTGDSAIAGRLSDGDMLLYFRNMPDAEADRMLKDIIQQAELPQNRVAGVTVSCSVGAAVMHGIVDYTSFYQEAEEALHIAKITKGEQYIRV